MQNKALHIFSILLLTVGMATTARAQSPQSKIKIHGNVYGGGDQAAIGGNTTVTINKGEYGGSIYGGGNGALYTADDEAADPLHIEGTVKASADIGTYYDGTDGEHEAGTLKEGTGDTHVTINGGEIIYYVGDENNLRNIYGGGNAACNVAGSTHVEMTKGMITTWSFLSSDHAMAAWRYFYDNSMKPNQQKTPICSVFGAGYGAHTDVAGNTNVNIKIPGTADIKPADGKAFTHAELEEIDHLGLRMKPDTKLSEQFVPSIFGGGFDGTVGAYDATANAGAGGINYDKTTCTSQANITIKGQPFVFNVYGGGLGSKSGADATGGVNSHVGAVYGATKVDIQGGLYNGNLFGGGAGIEAEDEIPNPFGGTGTIKMPYTYAAQVMRETDVTISGNSTVIYGNVYGGGDIANTGWYYESARPSMTDHVEQVNNSKAKLDYTTSLKLNGGNILGSAFGGGNGRKKAQMTMSMFVGTVCGSTNVSLNGTKVWSHVYGGGNMGTVFTCQTIAASKGESGRTMATGVIDGCTNVAILDGMVAKDIFGGGFGDDPGTGDADVTSADIYGNTYVYFKNADFEYSKYWKPREFLPSDATNEQMLAEVTGQFLDQSSAGDKRNTESDITHNLYGGGNMACDVKGNAHVYMIGAPTAPAKFSESDYYKECIENVAKPHFSVFGGGYGNKATVTKNAYCDINLGYGTGLHSIVGGGLNGTVGGKCFVHVGNDPESLVHFVYGGGYYAPCAGTSLDITCGTILENVYGGAVMGNINVKDGADPETDVATNTTIGLKSAGAKSSVVFTDENGNKLRSYTYAQHQNKITIYGDVYGGNDVSGTVNGIAKLTVYGGTIKGNVYGAGNGNHIGYYIPGALKYDLGKHGSDNYFDVDHKDPETHVSLVTGKTYVGRPQTIGGVNLTLEGNTKDERVKVLGQVFGGGNSCTIGAWDKTLLTTTYAGNPHLVRDDPTYFLGGGSLDINLGSHVTIGRTHEQLAEDADGSKYIDNDENVSGLFMGCSGKDLATQNGAYTKDNYYHHFFDYKAKRYYPGFAVGDELGVSMTRAEQLKPFQAYLNNIMVRSDEVHLNFADNATDIWLANFVGGGFRGSMRAKTEDGKFDYMLPEGVTVSHTVVGGAYNAHVQYRVFATNDDGTFVDGDNDGKYDYLTVVPGGWKQMVPANPDAECDYIKTLHEDAKNPTKITGILRYNFNGGILSDNSTGVSTSDVGHRIHNVHADPKADPSEYATAYFEPMTAGSVGEEDETTKNKLFTANKDNVLLHLDLRCALEPEVFEKEKTSESDTKYRAHGGNVFGGCFLSGFVEGDSWVDYNCWLSPKCAQSTDPGYKYFFDKNDNMHIYGEVADLETNNALSVYGAGYGTDTHSDGDVYLYIKSLAHTATGDADPAGMFPYIYNAFGGSNMGTVAGNTNVYYAVGKQGTLLGSLYGGGYKGDIEGNTFVELAEGFVTNVYGGSRQADIHGAAHVWAYDGMARGITDANHLIICNLYGGNDIAGTIRGTMPAMFTASKWDDAPHEAGDPRPSLTGKTFNSYVEISADDGSANRSFPLIGSAYAGGNGVEWAEDKGDQPVIANALIEIDGGSTLRAFGGGNMATVTEGTYIFTNAQTTTAADVTFAEYQKNIMEKVFFNGVTGGYEWQPNTTDGKLTRLVMDPYHVSALFGGNNQATMNIQPTWNLWKGKIENVYSGGNMGDMTYYNADGGTVGHEKESKGLSITIDSDDIFIKSLYGGCRMSDVKAMNGDIPVDLDEDEYGATVNVVSGYINNVFGGNDVSGTVYNGTNVNISGAVSGNVYGSGNGNYYYQWDKDVKKVTEAYNDEYGYTYYKVPMYYGADKATDTEKILTINHWRPSVNKAYLNISGSESKVAYVKGNVYCGGNASTVEGDNAHTKFNIGSYVTLNGVFMGSDGKEFSSSDNISHFESLNNFNMTDDVKWPSSWTDDEENACDAAVVDADKVYYPTMLSLYMKAVEMNALPQGYQGSLDAERTNAYIGTFCGGGNRGSMTIGSKVNMTLPSNIIIYDKVVAGCLDANVTYKNGTKEVTNIGGYYRPMSGDDDDRTKLNYTVECQFLPKVMDVPADMDSETRNSHGEDFTTAMAKGFLYDNVSTAMHVKTRKTIDVYGNGCNIYGGCYNSGDVLGNIVLDIKSSMLKEPLQDNEVNVKLANTLRGKELLKNTVDAACAAFNVYGAGYGLDSHVYGNVYITLDNTTGGSLPTFDKLTCPSASNINGGGRSGYLYGNSYINILNGIVFNNVIGGSDAGYQYGSTHIAVGDPVMYECNTQGDYTLDRADKWNEDKGNHDGTHPVTKSLKLMKGDRVSEAVYNKIKDNSKNSYFAACYVPGSAESSRLNWTNRKIHIGAGIYAGGFALATGSAVYAGDYTVRKLKEGNRWKNVATGEEITDIDGYAGNANIMVADDPLNATTGETDHISISTIVDNVKSGMTSKMGYFTRTGTGNQDALGNPVYSYDHQSDGAPESGVTYYELKGNGGIYGDGHLSFVEGFRSADVQRYGYAEHNPQDPKLLNTLQRLDFVRMQDCCVMLQGATDFAVNANSGEVFSIARVRELYLESNISPETPLDPGTKNSDTASADRRHKTKRSRNYLGFFNNVHYIGAIATNDDFNTAKYHDEMGAYNSGKTYQENKQDYITADYDEENHVIKDGTIPETTTTYYDHFKLRNIGTARNMIGINNGYTLKLQNVYTTATTQPDGSFVDIKDHMYYGPIVGVCEVKLLTLVVGEGGGYVYADNVHSNGSKFMNTSGNFVFPGTVDDSNPQYVVDDCFPKNFAGTNPAEEHQDTEAYDPDRPAHYWYVMGNKYFFTNTITGYTYGEEGFTGTKALQFHMDNIDQIITLSGTKKTDVVRIKNIKWEHPHGSHYIAQDGQSCDIADTEKNGYLFNLSLSTSDKYNTDGGYIVLPRVNTYTEAGEYGTLIYAEGKDNGQESPLLAIRLDDSQVNNTEDYWKNHLSDPCRVTFDLESGTGNPSNIYTYHITLNIVYVQGPRVTGKLHIDNCAMPGELIHAEAKELKIETDEAMPVTGTAWRFVNPNPDATDEEKYDYVVSYNQYIDHSKADMLAKYRYNGWGLQYVVSAGNNSFPVSLDSESPFSSLLVHNYHEMSHVNDVKGDIKDKLEPQAGARIYIKDKAGWEAFIAYLNAATEDNTYGIPVGMEGIKVYLQSDIGLDAAPEISVPFRGELNGDGYNVTIPSGTSLFGGNLAGSAKVYNLGLIGGSSITNVENTTENCFVADATAHFLYGKMAYDLSHYYKTTDAAEGYINGNRYAKGAEITAAHDDVPAVYAGGDWQYARLANNDERMLRTDDPNYGNVATKHNTAHTAAEIVAHDCLFFGQALNPTDLASKPYPQHIDDTQGGMGGKEWLEENRVYRTAGYYQSKTDNKFYYNKKAWALRPTLTAIDFSAENPETTDDGNFYGNTDDRPNELTSFNVDSNKDAVTEYSNASTGHVTQNLLVYNAGESVFNEGSYADKTVESAIRYHSIIGSGSIATIENFHLVDKQNFNAPIAFEVTNRAWYERTPSYFRNVGVNGYANTSAWEGICLPFTARRVSASENKEISHFYGSGSDVDTDGNNINALHHEYWLTGFTELKDENGTKTATFARPASATSTGVFYDAKHASSSYTYSYPANTYFTELTRYTDYHDDDDSEGDEWVRSDAEWYLSKHDFINYVPLTASVPYLISFPGNDFYEFSLEGVNYEDHSKSRDSQIVTFENTYTLNDNNYIQIGVSDGTGDEKPSTTEVGTYRHVGTYMGVKSASDTDKIYGINTTEDATHPKGSVFNDESPVLPFRTYMTTTSTAAPITRSILISDGYITEIGEESHPADELGEDYLKIWGEGHDIIVETSEARSFSLYGLNGSYLGQLQCKPGVNRFSQSSEGIYLVGKTKVVLF